MEEETEVIKAELANGTIVHIQVTVLGDDEEAAFGLPSFKQVTNAIEGIAESIVTTLKKVALEAGELTALLVKGSGTSNLKITLEWGEASSV